MVAKFSAFLLILVATHPHSVEWSSTFGCVSPFLFAFPLSIPSVHYRKFCSWACAPCSQQVLHLGLALPHGKMEDRRDGQRDRQRQIEPCATPLWLCIFVFALSLSLSRSLVCVICCPRV